MAETRIEADRERIPVRVYHRHGRETWTHPWLERCELCESQPRFTLANRRRVLKHQQKEVQS